MHYLRWYSSGDPQADRPPKQEVDAENRRARLAAAKRARAVRELEREQRDCLRAEQARQRAARRLEREAHQREKKRLAIKRTRQLSRERQQRRETGRERRYDNQLRWRERNLDYVRRQARKAKEKRKEIPGPRNGEPWTPAENAIALRDDLTITEMCYMLERGYIAVCAHRSWMNNSLIQEDRQAKVQRNRLIRRLYSDGWNYTSIASKLDCSRAVVHYAIHGAHR